MAVCLKCGKEIKKGNNYCDDCGSIGKAQVDYLFRLVEGNQYKPGRRTDLRWFVVILLGMMAVILGFLVAFLASVPSGPGFTARAHASICRVNLERIEKQIERYHKVEKRYPPTGYINSKHPLIVDQYLDAVPRCSVTKHPYLLKHVESFVIVTCDSGLEGHVCRENKK